LNNANEIAIIAEIKKASPSKGIIAEKFDYKKIFEEYVDAEADAISVLTDEKYFKGSLNYLSELSRLTPVPLLRKDFIIDEIQIYEAKSFGADAILLIAEILSASQIDEYFHCAKEIGIESLIEVHKEESLKKINLKKTNLIGINNRNLETFETTLTITELLAPQIPKHVTIVSESGIESGEEVKKAKRAGAKAVLVGEALMKAQDKKQLIREFKMAAAYDKN